MSGGPVVPDIRAVWQANAVFSPGDVFTYNGGVYEVTTTYTSGGSFGATDLANTTAWEAQSGTYALTAQNLADLASAATARTNLGLGTAATHPSTDFAPSTGIAESAVTNLVADLASKVASTSAARIAASIESDVAFSNTAAEQTFATLALPTNLKAGDRLLVRAHGELLNNSAGAVTFAPKLKIGTTTLISPSGLSLTASATSHTFVLEFVVAVASTSSELATGFVIVAAASANFSTPTGQLWTRGTAAEDLTVAKNVVLTWQMGTADAQASVTLHTASVAILPK